MNDGGRKRYPSDLTDQQWEITCELIPQPRKSRKGGRPRTVDMCEVVNTILYQCRSGCQWDMLPHDLLPKSTVQDYFAKWRDDGTLRKVNERLVGAIRMLEAPINLRRISGCPDRTATSDADRPSRSCTTFKRLVEVTEVSVFNSCQ